MAMRRNGVRNSRCISQLQSGENYAPKHGESNRVLLQTKKKEIKKGDAAGLNIFDRDAAA